MRKTLSILLLFSILLYTGGYHFACVLYQSYLKQDMKYYLQHSDNTAYGTHLCLSLTDGRIMDPAFAWEEENTEFRYRNEWYDVISVKKTAGKILICCLKDGNENEIEKQWNELHHKNKDASSSLQLSLLKFCSSLQAFYEMQPRICDPFLAAYCITCTTFFLNNIKEIHTPPPRPNC
jgi:hypothetical protein